MIFKTYETDLDGISNKLGFNKRSFAEWGTQVSQSFNNAGKGLKGFKQAFITAFSTSIKLISKADFSSIFPVENAESFFKSFNQNGSQSIATLTRWCDELGVTDKTMKAYLVDCMQKQVPASFDGYNNYVQSAIANNKQLTLSAKAESVALKALSIAGNMIVMWGISKAISIAASVWDHFNVTVKEVQENVDELTSNIKSLNAELDELKGKDSLTDAEQNRLKYLETRVDLEERLLKIEQTRLAQEQLGKSSKVTDWFDDDSYVKKATKEFGVYALDGNYFTNPGFNTIPFAFINGYNAYNNGAEAVIREGNEQYKKLKNLNKKYEELIKERDAFKVGSLYWQIWDKSVTRIASKLETYQKK